MFESLKIVGFSVLCAVVYGILHDLLTAHVCVEYFTVAHPPVFGTSNPVLLALGWGVIATWWVGAILGSLLALCAQSGRANKVSCSDLKRPIVMLMLISAAAAMIAGVTGWVLTSAEVPGLIGYWESVIAPERHARFAFSAWAHSASYLVGGVGGLLLAGITVLKRVRGQTASTSSTNSG